MKTVKQFPRKTKEIANQWVVLADGTRLAARIWLPTDAEQRPVPAILEYLPYRKRDGTHVRDALTHPYLAGHGYACVRVDMRGSGESDGLMFDEYTQQELDDAVEVIAWLAQQSWCSGAVGMMGISWGGFNALQVAALRPPALKAIITLCSTDDRYSDDIHYKGGCLLGENMGWAATMLAYSSRAPDPALVGERWRAMWVERLQNEPFLIGTWLEHPTRDRYWKHGSVCEDIDTIEAAVLAIGGWHDAYTNAVPRLVRNVQAPVKGIIGPWAHRYPHFAVPEPRIGFLQEALRWWDRWLKGVDTGVLQDPAHRTYIMDVIKPGASMAFVPGRWVSDAAWPAPGMTKPVTPAKAGVQRGVHWIPVIPAQAGTQSSGLAGMTGDAKSAAPFHIERLHLNSDGLGATKGKTTKRTIHSPQNTGADSGEFCVIWLGPEFPGDQRRDDACSLTFDAPALTQDIDLFGAAVLHLSFSVNKPIAQVAVRLNSIWPDGSVSRLSYAVRNLCHLDGPDASIRHDKPQALVPGKTYKARIQLDDMAWHLPKGHKLRVSISTCYWPLIWPSPEAATLNVHAGASHIDIPVRSKRRFDAPTPMLPAEAAPAVRLQTIDKAWNKRELIVDQATGETRLEIVDDFGRSVIEEHGMQTWARARESYSILPHDPLSARQFCHWTEERSRGDWRVRTETYSELRASKTHWLASGRLEAYEGDALVLKREWSRKIKRKFG